MRDDMMLEGRRWCGRGDEGSGSVADEATWGDQLSSVWSHRPDLNCHTP